VLARQQSRRHHDSDLLAIQCDRERRAQRDLGVNYLTSIFDGMASCKRGVLLDKTPRYEVD
jgi:hypothetical protein